MKYAVCYNLNLEPISWGSIVAMNENMTVIRYSKNSPIWDSKTWENKYIKVFDTELEAEKIVIDFNKSRDYDERS